MQSSESTISVPKWLSKIKPEAVITLSPEDVWESMDDEKKASVTREEFLAIFESAANMLSRIDCPYWETIKQAVNGED